MGSQSAKRPPPEVISTLRDAAAPDRETVDGQRNRANADRVQPTDRWAMICHETVS